MSKVEFFIGGGGDKKDFLSGVVGGGSKIMNGVMAYRKKTSVGIVCKWYGHEDQTKLLDEIKQKWKSNTYTSIRLTGHSWGGQAAMDLTQDLFRASIPVDELITLDPVSLWPFSEVVAGKWVNVFAKHSLMDNSIGAVPVLGNLVSGLTSWAGLLTGGSSGGDYVANWGGQLGSENGAHNVEVNVPHEKALTMYVKARAEMQNVQSKPKAIGVR